jgi:hypothetical protein
VVVTSLRSSLQGIRRYISNQQAYEDAVKAFNAKIPSLPRPRLPAAKPETNLALFRFPSPTITAAASGLAAAAQLSPTLTSPAGSISLLSPFSSPDAGRRSRFGFAAQKAEGISSDDAIIGISTSHGIARMTPIKAAQPAAGTIELLSSSMGSSGQAASMGPFFGGIRVSTH